MADELIEGRSPIYRVGDVVTLRAKHDVEEGFPVEGMDNPLAVAPILDGATRFVGVVPQGARAGELVEVEVRRAVYELESDAEVVGGERVERGGVLLVALGPAEGGAFQAVRV